RDWSSDVCSSDLPLATANLKPASTGTYSLVLASKVVSSGASPCCFNVLSKFIAPRPTATYGLMKLLKKRQLVLAIVHSPDSAADHGIFVENSWLMTEELSASVDWPSTVPPIYCALIPKEGEICFLI